MQNWKDSTRVFGFCAILFSAQMAIWGMSSDQPTPFEVRGGSVTFDVATNVSALSVHGRSNAMQAQMHVERTAENLIVHRIEAALPPASLNTGMGLRDEHMRKYIFTTENGQMPELRFVAEKTVCPLAPSGKEVSCQIEGNMTIRGLTKTFTIAMKLKEENPQTIRAVGETVVKLADYGINAPSQFGVKTADEVKVHLEFTGKRALPTISKGGTND